MLFDYYRLPCVFLLGLVASSSSMTFTVYLPCSYNERERKSIIFLTLFLAVIFERQTRKVQSTICRLCSLLVSNICIQKSCDRIELNVFRKEYAAFRHLTAVFQKARIFYKRLRYSLQSSTERDQDSAPPPLDFPNPQGDSLFLAQTTREKLTPVSAVLGHPVFGRHHKV